jgi:hypothetical protein
MEEVIKKKRGRKPKNFYSLDAPDTEVLISEKKKRGRKKKYEIENFDKILNREHINNFNHNIIYSDSEECPQIDKLVKKVAFGNLDITISKNKIIESNHQEIVKSNKVIVEDEYSDEDEIISPAENTIDYQENKKYTTDFTDKIKEQSIKRLHVVTCMKDIIPSTEWPEKTDTCCWWCCHTFKGCPCTMPTKYDPLRKRFTFVGIFCSWNCTKSYNLDKNDQKKYERSGLITLLIQQLYGIVHALGIKAAPPRQCLKMFGGYLDIEAFRNNCSTVDAYHLNLIKYNFIYPEITEVSNIKLKQAKTNLRLFRI